MFSPRNLKEFDTLVKIVAVLGSPEGCPWDQEQTHASIRGDLLEECYEVLEALDEEDIMKLSYELGDLLMQVVLHARIAADAGEFEMGDVIRNINTKLINRHPHVFGSVQVKGPGEALANWEALKKEERGAEVSMLEHVPKQMPALSYSQEIQDRVSRVGFDWENVEGVIDKLIEEVGELKEVENQEQREQEFGDLFFTLANVARWQGVDSESALRQASKRFYRRFTYMEKLCYQRKFDFGELSFAEQNSLWEEAKQEVR